MRFILFPMVHVGEQQFYDEVAARARLCQVIVAEGIPSQFLPAQEWMARQHWGPFVDQVAALRLETLGVPVYWEATLDHRPENDARTRPSTGRLDEIHRDRAAEPASAGVVFGAAHMPAVAAHLSGKLGYIAANSEWLTVAHGKS